MTLVRHLWAHHRAALCAFVLALAALGYFGGKTVSSTIYWMDPAHIEQPLAGWMTPRYIGQSYGLPREAVLEALMMDPDAPPQRVSLSEIATRNDMTMDDLQARVDAAADLWGANQPPRDAGASR